MLRSYVQETGREIPVTYFEREAETACAMQILGCPWEQWSFPDTAPIWTEVKAMLDELHSGWDAYDRVWAPLPEPDGGHPHHDVIGRLAGQVWGDRASYYTTYRNGRERSQSGDIIEHPYEWEKRKAEALACYTTQRQLWSTAHHFDSALADPTEYEVTPPSTTSP